jgi:hypothetical protein
MPATPLRDGSLCAHPDGCKLGPNASPLPAVARWRGLTPFCNTHYHRARRNAGDPGPSGLAHLPRVEGPPLRVRRGLLPSLPGETLLLRALQQGHKVG